MILFLLVFFVLPVLLDIYSSAFLFDLLWFGTAVHSCKQKTGIELSFL